MIYFLFAIIIMIFLLYIVQKRNDLDISDPILLFLGSHCLSIIFVILNFRNWEVGDNFSAYATQLIIGSMLAFIGGAFGAKLLYFILPKKKVYVDKSTCIQKITIYNMTIFACTVLIVFSGVIYLSELSRKSGISLSNIITFMTIVRSLITDGAISVGIVSTQLISICRAIAYVFIYAFLWNSLYFNKRQYKLLVVPIAYSILTLVTSGRILLLYMVIYIVIIYFLLSKSINIGKINKTIKIFLSVLLGIVVFFALFGALANVVGRNTSHTIYEQISVYAGGSIISFNNFINDFDYSSPSIYGEESLVGIYSLLNTMRITEISVSRHLPFTRFGNSWGNVYMAIRRYIHDFDIVQAFLIMMIIGFVYYFIYECVHRKKILTIKHIYYGMLIYPIPMLVIDDVLFSSMISLNTILDIIYVAIAYRLLIQIRKKKRI